MHRTSKKISMWVLTICALCLLGLAAPTAWTQENSAGIQGTIKDQSGAVISGATVEITSPALQGAKSLKTDSGGWFRFANLPPGIYTIEVTADGFRKYRATNIELNVGRMPTRDISLEIGAIAATVEVSAEGSVVDVSQSRVQTVVTESSLNNLPMGRSFQTVIQFAPGARTEPLQGGYQIDGASNSENSYLVEGQETSDIQSGASNTNVPREFIQEVQIKSSGFEAEYGGALGGVVNVIQKRGGNVWHGSVFTYYQSDAFDSPPIQTLRRDPNIQANNTTRLDSPPQIYTPIQDHYRYLDPGFEVGGKLIQDRLWVFAAFVPRILNTRRTVNMAGNVTPFNQQSTTYYGLARADLMVTQKIRVFGSWQTNYNRTTGAVLPGADEVTSTLCLPADPCFNPSSQTPVSNYTNSIGYVQPRVLFNVGADWTILPSLVATTRFGRLYQDYQDRGLPTGIRYFYRSSNYSYSTGSAGTTAATAALDGSLLGVADPTAIHATGFSNIGANLLTVFDKYSRLSFSQDVAYFKKAFGTHNFKAGYAFNKLENNVTYGYNTADVYVAFNIQYSPRSTAGKTVCDTIIAQNIVSYGVPGGTLGTKCQGNWGTVNIRDLGTAGKVASWNHALYLQDSWTVAKGVTLNLGVRFDKESLPSYNPLFLGIKFGFTDKVAPRLGGAWDVLGNGKLKVSASYAQFYDIMKFEMPRGSFGGDYWHDCVYAMDTTNFSGIIPTRDANNHYCPLSGGANGTLPAGLRFIENFDFRVPSNDSSRAGSLGPTGLVDPNLKPMKQNAIVVGAEWVMMPNLVFEARYTRKRLVRTIDDTGIITPSGEQYYISNPGMGVNTAVPTSECVGCPPNPKANRRYDGLEFRVTRRAGARWFGSLSYTYSALRGNYSGLTATDISDGGGARNSPNVDRSFDEPNMSFDAHGKVIDGPLATDRPNTFKAVGWYNLKWWGMETTIGGFQQVYQGTPLSTYESVWGAPVFIEGRGKFVDVTRNATTGDFVLGNVSSRRTPIFSQTDMSLSHKLHVSKTNEFMQVGFEIDVFNLFNQKAATLFQSELTAPGGDVAPYQCAFAGGIYQPPCPATSNSGIDYKSLLGGFNYINESNGGGQILNSLYGMPYGWQNPRSVRFRVMFIF